MNAAYSSPSGVKFFESFSTTFTESKPTSIKSSLRLASPLAPSRPMRRIEAPKVEEPPAFELDAYPTLELDNTLTKHSTVEATPVNPPSVKFASEKRSQTPRPGSSRAVIKRRKVRTPCIIDTSFRDLSHNRSAMEQKFLHNYRQLFPKSKQGTMKNVKVSKVLFSQLSSSALSSHRWKRTTSKERLLRIQSTEASRGSIRRNLVFQNPDLKLKKELPQFDDKLLRDLNKAERLIMLSSYGADYRELKYRLRESGALKY
mmetsp:Transcript_11292/g.22225  ORF Transcript_11292/g.22225 Transcript_11292/m.22225 type:complete len:259 (+) Transcript_11292:17-793(+)